MLIFRGWNPEEYLWGTEAVLWKKNIFIKFVLVIKYASHGPAV